MNRKYNGLNGVTPSIRHLLTKVIFKSDREFVDWVIDNSEITIESADDKFYHITFGKLDFVSRQNENMSYDDVIRRIRRKNQKYFRKVRWKGKERSY